VRESAKKPPLGLVTVREVAAHAGVGMSTVSNAVNHPERLTSDTLARVNASIAELGFVRNSAARQLRLGASQVFGMVVIDAGSPYFAVLERAVEDEAERSGYSVLLGNSGQDPARQARHVALFESQRLQGLLVTPIDRDLSTLDAVQKRGTPVMLVDHSDPAGRFSSVSVDHLLGGRLAVEHLIAMGRRRIGVVRGPVSFPQVEDRLRGAEEAAHAAPGVELVPLLASALTFEGGLDLAWRLLDLPSNQRPDAIFAATDQVAIGVIEAIVTRSGADAVPAQIAVVGYDDVAYAESSRVPVTSVRQPIKDLGRRATELLVQHINETDQVFTDKFKPELIVRASSGPSRLVAEL
jgi:LacI family transcriptional regulator